MGPTADSSPRTWEIAASPGATTVARRYEAAWRASHSRERPGPHSFYPPRSEPEFAAIRLAVLRADLGLNWEAGTKLLVERYLDLEPDLDAETVVALLYEEFCLREEFGEAPVPIEYEERFPDLVERLRRVFDIHELVGTGSTAPWEAEPPQVAFPDAGQTIAGFRLVEELGRGAFARVFLAQERQLADRPVALKVARHGSREPQTLARLQHTNIVPIHSYRTDPATGLHLLCMPYFGRVTLGRLLEDPHARTARAGADLLAVLDRLDPPIADAPVDVSMARSALVGLPFPRAIAWWGARLAEALAYAHDRGVLHRDIKPSNVLLTADGLPMLLDFNLARGRPASEEASPDDSPETPGGTLGYMSPEHLDAMARGDAESSAVDRRSDVYSLGVLLYESLTGARPFASPVGVSSVVDALNRAAELRRRGVPRLRDLHPEIPEALEAVVLRCLAPDASRRYQSATELAADLQAVAEDAPLRHAVEPFPSRAIRFLRRHRRRIGLLGPITVAVAAVGISVVRSHEEYDRLDQQSGRLIAEGHRSLLLEDYSGAAIQFEAATVLLRGQPAFLERSFEARTRLREARQLQSVRDQADRFSSRASALRRRLLDDDPERLRVAEDVERLLQEFGVLVEGEDWSRSPLLLALDTGRRSQLEREVDELLFFYVATMDPGSEWDSRRAVALCEHALKFSVAKTAWQALRSRFAPTPSPTSGEGSPWDERSSRGCFAWGVLLDRAGRSRDALPWLERAASLDESNAWYHHYLASLAGRLGRNELALRHYVSAVILLPRDPRLRLERSRIEDRLGYWQQAREDRDLAGEFGPPRLN